MPDATVLVCKQLSLLNEQLNNSIRRNIMKWETPAYEDLRFGFEVTMYIMNR